MTMATITTRCWLAPLLASVCLAGAALESTPSQPGNGGFESGFTNWSRWGSNADRITLDRKIVRSGTNAARIAHGHNALFFAAPLTPGQAYELAFAYRLAGDNPAGQVALAYVKPGGALNSAGREVLKLTVPAGRSAGDWIEFRKVFLPPRIAGSAQFAFSAGERATIWLDDVSLREVPRPAGLTEPPDPWAGLQHRTANPLFRELLTSEPGGYTVVCWAHDLNAAESESTATNQPANPAAREAEIRAILQEAGRAGMGFLNLPGWVDGKSPWRTPAFLREQFETHGARFDVWTEGSGSVAAALKNGAELLNPTAHASGRRPSVSWVDPRYVEAQEQILREVGARLRGEPFVGYYYGKDEPRVHLPEGPPAQWGEYGRTMAAAVREQYGFGRFAVPQPGNKEFESDPDRPLRWIAYNRWMNDQFIASRGRLREALRAANPDAKYSPADYWFMSGFVPYDHTRLAACSDLMELDPYASSAERVRGRGVFNHGFGAKFMRDLTGKPVRIVAQAFDYAGYAMSPDDLREWVSQALRCGASAIDYYTLDRPRTQHPDRWRMMLHLAHTLTRMNRLRLPETADTAVLYTLYTHMSHGESTPGDQVYAAHALLGEQAGSWFQFVSDTQLERGERKLGGYKTVYLPLGQYMTVEATQQIEAYVRAGGVLVCGDADAFGSDLAGNDTSAARARILGIKTLGPKAAEEIVLTQAAFGLASGSRLKLFDIKLWDETTPGRARAIEVVDKNSEVLAAYSDGTPALVSRTLGRGRVFTFAANPFAPLVTVDAGWPALFKGLQKSLGCTTDLPIWRFQIPNSKSQISEPPGQPPTP